MEQDITLVHGDNRQELEKLPADCADLVYIDGPHNTNKSWELPDGQIAFEDRWEAPNDYFDYMEEIINRCWGKMAVNSSIFIQCPPKVSHVITKIAMEVFGRDNFVNQLIWHKTGGGRSATRFSEKHDVILWFSLGKDYRFNPDAVRVPYSLTSGYAKAGIRSKKGKQYLPNPDGTVVDSVWDIPMVNPMSEERTGYPTQKPLLLMQRIIKGCSNEGNVVLDPFAGSGTTLVAAKQLKRKAIGIDNSLFAIEHCKARLERMK